MAKSFQQIADIAHGGIATLDNYRLIADAKGDTSVLGHEAGENKRLTAGELAKQFANELESVANAFWRDY